MDLEISKIKFTEHPVELEEIKKIAESMDEKGLINALTVREENGSYHLVAGEKRLRAALMLGWDAIRIEIVSAASADEQEELSLHENLKRANLPWYDEAELVLRLHELRQKQHGAAPEKGGRPKKDAEKAGWGMRETAEELGRALGPLNEDINLAREVRNNPSLRNVKDKQTAIKLVRRTAKQSVMELEAGAPKPGRKNEILLGSSDELLKHIPAMTFDFCFTDPPWIEFRGMTEKLVKDAETWPVFEQIYRTLKHNSFLAMFVGFDDFFWYREHLPNLGFRVSQTPRIWSKPGALTRFGDDSWNYGRDYELILTAIKGKPVFSTSGQKSGVITVPPIHATKLVHPHEKPLALLTQMIKDISFEGSLMLDPFMGSGAHVHAAKLSGRNYIGIERDPKFFKAIQKRMA